jgi:hypothetical protein
MGEKLERTQEENSEKRGTRIRSSGVFPNPEPEILHPSYETFLGGCAPSGPWSQSWALETFGTPHW